MRLVHDAGDTARPLATEVEVAESLFEQARGLMFRSSVPEDYALVFPFDRASRQFIHMLFVRFPLDVVWLLDEKVQAVKTLAPWRSVGYAKADTVIELPGGAASAVAEGDIVRLEHA